MKSGTKNYPRKNWVNLKLHFTKVHKRMRESKAIVGNAGYGAANSALMQETATHLENLATTTAADCNVVSSLSDTNTRLVTEIAVANTTLAVAVADIAVLTVQINGMSKGGRGRGRGSGRGAYQHSPGGRGQSSTPRTIRRFNNTNCCFSCGYNIADWHNGETCPWKKVNHATDATRADTEGGSQEKKFLVE